MNKNRLHTTTHKGSVLVVSVVITTVLTSIGIAFASILEKERRKQVYNQRSQIALNIANSALECTLYNDFHRLAFDRGIFIECGDEYGAREQDDWYRPFKVTFDRTLKDVYTYEIVERASKENKKKAWEDLVNVPCARVTVRKGEAKTIEVKGYDRCSSGNEAERNLVRRFKVIY